MKIFLVEKNEFEYDDQGYIDNDSYEPQMSFTSRDRAEEAKNKLEISQYKYYGEFSSLSEFLGNSCYVEKFLNVHFPENEAEVLVKKLYSGCLEFSDIPDKLLPEFLAAADISFAKIVEVELD